MACSPLAQIILSWEPFSSDWQIECKVLDIFWDLTAIGISLAILVKERKLEMRKQ